MRVVATPPLRAGSIEWLEQPGQASITVVCKATYVLRPEVCELSDDPEELVDAENHWDDDPGKSVYAPSDLAPAKGSPEVVLVGSAFAPGGQPVRSLRVRLAVGAVDKSIEVVASRTIGRDGTLREGPSFSRMSLRYERAAGGAGTENPVGLGVDPKSSLRELPNLQPPGTQVRAFGDRVATSGFGPIAAGWPDRISKDPPPSTRSFPPTLGRAVEAGFFQCAPEDQWLATLDEDEAITLENLVAGYERLETRLPGVRPRARVEGGGASAWELHLAADTLWIDTQRGLCTVTWRGQLPRDAASEGACVRLGLEGADGSVRWPSEDDAGVRGSIPPPPSRRASDAEDTGSLDFAHTSLEDPEAYLGTNAALPFRPSNPGASRPPAPRLSDGGVHAHDWESGATHDEPAPRAAQPSWLHAPASRPSQPPAPTSIRPAPPSYLAPGTMGASVVPPVAPGPIVGASGASLPAAARLGVGPTLGALAPVTPTGLAPRVGDPSPPPPLVRPMRPAQTDPLHVGVLASSNAAAAAPPVEPASPRADEPPDRAPPRSPGRNETRPLLEVIWAAPELAPKLRAHASWKALFESEDRARSSPDDDRSSREKPSIREDSSKESKGAASAPDADRAALATVLGRAAPTTDVEAAMWSNANADGVLGTSLVLVAGELELMFDEARTLEATVAAASPLASTDKRLKETIDSNAELAKSPLATAPGLAAGLTQRIREAWSKANRTLPADALDVSARTVLLDQRAYQRKPLWGGSFVRALLGSTDGARVPAYLPDEVAGQLPLVHRLPIRAIAEALPQQDPSEAHAVALRVLALARVVTPKRRGT